MDFDYKALIPCWATNIPDEYKLKLTELIESMIWVEGGAFTMGATPEQGQDADDDEKPAHGVVLDSYYISKYEVTQELWQMVMGVNPSTFKGEKNPVENVSYNDCLLFIDKLQSLTGLKFALPTEAQWEYAARGGNRSCGYKYSGGDDKDCVAWCRCNSEWKSHPVGLKSPNELGLYDMSGNVWEWCNDTWHRYDDKDVVNPKHEGDSTSYRMKRGGCWLDNDCRVSDRDIASPDGKSDCLGFRLVINPD